MVSVIDVSPQVNEETALCAHCQRIQTCEPYADLQALAVSRGILESEYGWDIFSFVAEAKRQYRKARDCHCPRLAAVQAQAAIVAPEVDFTRVGQSPASGFPRNGHGSST
jgi:hypothetical protein